MKKVYLGIGVIILILIVIVLSMLKNNSTTSTTVSKIYKASELFTRKGFAAKC